MPGAPAVARPVGVHQRLHCGAVGDASASTEGGRHRARLKEVELIEGVARHKGGGKWATRRRSSSAGILRWSVVAVHAPAAWRQREDGEA
jgi:hypothetical protein